MALSQFEFALLASVLAAYLIFTPEPLIPLRNLLVWASLTWAAWHGYEHWHTTTWVRKLIGGFSTGFAFPSIIDIVRSFLDWKNEPASHSPHERSQAGSLTSSWLLYMLGWLPGRTNTPAGTITKHGASPAPGRDGFYAILVTTPTKQVYGPLSDHLFSTTDQPQRIPWDSTSTEDIPSMLDSLAFRRGFALCIIPADLWKSTKRTLVEKLKGQRFWDYYGEAGGSMATSWTRNQIDQINAIQQLGFASCGGDVVATCTGYYLQLRRNWNYFPIWWNDGDFAIILASLLVGDKEMSLCSALIRRRDELRQTEVIEPRRRACQGNSAAATGASMALGFAGPMAAPAVFTSMCWSVGSELVSHALKAGESSRQIRRQAACEELQEVFPRLRELFEKAS